MDNLTALQTEATGKPIEVTWRDRTFTIDPPEDWSLQYMHHAERGQMTLAIEAMLGKRQYGEFIAARPKPADLQALFTTALSAWGLDPKDFMPSSG